jgi:polyhydroxyalkanoic acid synthase PhaR subunit
MAQTQNGNKRNEEESVKMPDMVELWKKMYFGTEEMWGNALKENLTTKSFVGMFNEIKDQYLSFYKVSNQTLDQYLEANPIPSKKDVARVAELVIALEDKIDDFDLEFSSNMASMTESLLKIVDFHGKLKEEVFSIKTQLDSLSDKLEQIIDQNAAVTSPVTRKTSKKIKKPLENEYIEGE